MMVAALFVRKNSVYKSMDGVDAWDAERDARKWPGGTPAVCHPPCAQWGRMSQWAHKKPAEKALALFALDLVDRWGGVVEHPVTSRLWPHTEGRKGFLYTVDQQWFGHRAQKRTTLYVNGINPSQLPPIPYVMEEPTQPVQNMGTAESERTPPAMAEWLVSIAALSRPLASDPGTTRHGGNRQDGERGLGNKLITMSEATRIVVMRYASAKACDD